MHHLVLTNKASNMNKFVVFAFVLVVVLATNVASQAAQDTYTTKWDNIDLDQILSNERLVKNYMNCVLDKGNCTPDASELKRVLPEAIETDCKKCTENQKTGTKKVIKHLIKNYPELFKEVTEKYDPKGTYKARHPEDFA